MHPFLQMRNNFGQGKTNLELFIEEKARLEAIVNGPATTRRDRDNIEGSEWSLYAMNEIIDGKQDNDYMLEKYLTEIIKAKTLRAENQKQEALHNTYVNAIPPVLQAISPILN